MLVNVTETLKELEDYEEQHPLTTRNDLFLKIRWHLENLLLSYCMQEAIYQLGEKGYVNPSEELITKTTEGLFESERFASGNEADEIVEDVLSRWELNLSDLLHEDEYLAEYATTGSYSTYHCIMEKGSTHIALALENTLHRIMDLGGDSDDIYRIMGAYIPAEEERVESAEGDGFIEIDLGYVLPGYLIAFRITGAEGKPQNDLPHTTAEEISVTEECPHCRREITVQWDVRTEGYQIYCPSCGLPIILCSMCDAKDGAVCDWTEGKGCKHSDERYFRYLKEQENRRKGRSQ